MFMLAFNWRELWLIKNNYWPSSQSAARTLPPKITFSESFMSLPCKQAANLQLSMVRMNELNVPEICVRARVRESARACAGGLLSGRIRSVLRARVRLSAPSFPVDALFKRLPVSTSRRAAAAAAAAATNHHAITACRGSCLWGCSAN